VPTFFIKVIFNASIRIYTIYSYLVSVFYV
jgi:hypothetical protein